MEKQMIRSNLLLLLTAIIWGFAFVAQRVGMENLGPFTFNGIRFALGSLSLIPLILFFNRKNRNRQENSQNMNKVILAGCVSGVVLFAGASLQQVGLIYTTAGKAAFITGLYMILVPVLGIFLRHRTGKNTWIGALIAVSGLYLLSVTDQFTIARGDFLQLVGAFFWAAHILLISRFVRNINALLLSFIQCVTCSVLSLITAFFFEIISLSSVLQASLPLLYGGILSVGIAYTLQIVGQKHAHPSHAAIIMSLETVFAALGGYIVLNEQLGLRNSLGCLLMLSGMLVSQLQSIKKETAI